MSWTLVEQLVTSLLTGAYGSLRISSYLFCRKNCKIGLLRSWQYLDVSEL
jgi:hypothetical protein